MDWIKITYWLFNLTTYASKRISFSNEAERGRVMNALVRKSKLMIEGERDRMTVYGNYISLYFLFWFILTAAKRIIDYYVMLFERLCPGAFVGIDAYVLIKTDHQF